MHESLPFSSSCIYDENLSTRLSETSLIDGYAIGNTVNYLPAFFLSDYCIINIYWITRMTYLSLYPSIRPSSHRQLWWVGVCRRSWPIRQYPPILCLHFLLEGGDREYTDSSLSLNPFLWSHVSMNDSDFARISRSVWSRKGRPLNALLTTHTISLLWPLWNLLDEYSQFSISQP